MLNHLLMNECENKASNCLYSQTIYVLSQDQVLENCGALPDIFVLRQVLPSGDSHIHTMYIGKKS